MQTRQIVLRERCAPVTVFSRRRRFLLGASANRELGIPLLARAVRLMAVCGLLVSLTALPVRAQSGTWNEQGDAPPTTSGPLAGIPGQNTAGSGWLTSINGKTDINDEDVDIFCIRITDPSLFQAGMDAATTYPISLHLFDGTGAGVTQHSGSCPAPLYNTTIHIPSNYPFVAGNYWLAVASAGLYPQNTASNTGNWIWNPAAPGPRNEYPFPPNGSLGAVMSWWPFAQLCGPGTYRIALAGTEFCTPLSCPLPPGETICELRKSLGDCEGASTDLCRPTQLIKDPNGEYTAEKCECVSDKECYVQLSNTVPPVPSCPERHCPGTNKPCELTSTQNNNNGVCTGFQTPLACCTGAGTGTCVTITYDCCPPGCEAKADGSGCTQLVCPGSCVCSSNAQQSCDCPTGAGCPPGDTCDPAKLCVPTEVVQPANSVQRLVTKCDCVDVTNECYTNPNMAAAQPRCDGGPVCPFTGAQCTTLTTTVDPITQATTYACCPKEPPPERCPLPTPAPDDICSDLWASGECDGPLNEDCRPTQLKYDPMTEQYTAEHCACINEKECYLEVKAVGPPFPDTLYVVCRGLHCPGTNSPCQLTTTNNADGTSTYDCCPPGCGPLSDGSACQNTTCVDAGDTCKPTELLHNLTTGQITVTKCDCVSEEECYFNITDSGQFSCSANICPGMNEPCLGTKIPNGDGTETIFCCPKEQPPKFCPLPNQIAPDPCESFAQQPECLGNDPDECLPKCVEIVDDGDPSTPPYPVGTECTCADSSCCGTVTVDVFPGPEYGLLCLGSCQPGCPEMGGKCVLVLNGTVIGQVGVQGLAIGDTVCCKCVQTGACCDTLNGVCSESILETDCVGDHRIWTKDATCADVACDPTPGACCNQDVLGTCTVTTAMECDCEKCVWHKEQTCEDIECTHAVIPTVSHWGLVVLTLLLLIGAKVYFARRETTTAS